MQPQKSFGQFIADRYGPKWVYAAKRSERIARQYPQSVVITPKQQRQLAVDYAKEWGREYDPVFWQMLCALRAALEALMNETSVGVRSEEKKMLVQVLTAATTYRRA